MKTHINGVRIIPTEDEEQAYIVSWARIHESRYPELKLLYHIPNEGKRSNREGARMKSLGLRRGVSDLCLPVARCGFHGLYIELKAQDGKATAEQNEFIRDMLGQGYYARVCFGADEAVTVIEDYLKGEKK